MNRQFLKRWPSKAELRIARPNAYAHVYTHAVEGLNPFSSDELKSAWLDTLRRRLPGTVGTYRGPEVFSDIDVIAFATQSNHPHLVLRQGEDQTAIGRFVANSLRAFALHHNRVTGHTGQVFLRPFDAKHLATRNDVRRAIAYVHRNPKRPDLINKFTSHPDYLASNSTGFVNVERGLAVFGGRDEYADYFEKYCRAKDVEEGR
ncbi:MAG: hypothetical protein JHC98_04800 [Thermoleophilaceae bacterium]|nr:hypothetical protein [Thermoleophilaceae bacterium]